MSAKVVVKRKDSDAINKALAKLKKTEVLVGIPSEAPNRTDSTISNSALGYIHEHGSEVAGIPARPFLYPGVKKAQASIVKRLQGAVKAGMHGHELEMMNELGRAGMEAEMSVKNELSTANYAPLKPSTIANRFRGRSTIGRRDNEDPKNELFGVGIRPLINSGQLLKSITHIVK